MEAPLERTVSHVVLLRRLAQFRASTHIINYRLNILLSERGHSDFGSTYSENGGVVAIGIGRRVRVA